MKIRNFMNDHKDKKFLSTGDCNQLEPIGFESLNNIKHENRNDYLMTCIKILFPHMIRLKECKRLTNKEDIEKMNNMKKDIFDMKIPVMYTLHKYGFKTIKKIQELETKCNLSYFRYKCDDVNRHVMNNMMKNETIKLDKKKYWIGMNLVCRKHYKCKTFRLFVNYEYQLLKINNDTFTIYEPVEEVKIKLKIKYLVNFRHPYCNTVHSVQGMTMKDNYTIFNCDSPYVTRNWVYTALTRTDDMSKITIFQTSNQSIDLSAKIKIKHFYKNKCDMYKNQDKKMQRVIDDTYINEEWILKQLEINKSCSVCREPYETICENGYIHSNVSVDRIDNTLAHIKSNCRLMCVSCNVKRSNKAKD